MPLSFGVSTAPPTPLPQGVERTYIPSPQGQLELLSAQPKGEQSDAAPLFFVHGGFGCAAVWLEYMTYLSAAPHNIPCYAISLRGHGASWKPGYFRMTFGTTKRMLTDDIKTGVQHVEGLVRRRGAKDIRAVLAAHSNGGGLCQLALNDGDFQVRGLALLDATPPFGLLGVYWNWFKADPWFPLRVYPHLMHSRSPLSSTRLVKNAFFSDECPLDRVSKLEKLMSPFESLIWPSSMMTRFINLKRVLANVLIAAGKPSVLIMAAEKSRLMGVPMMRRMADEYAVAVADLLNTSGKDGNASDVAQAVSFEVVKRAGHHLQNDLNWEEGATKLARFYEATLS